MAQTDPEAAYFMVDGGERAGVIFFNVEDPADLARINEPLFASLNAAIEIIPTVSWEDLLAGLPKAEG